MSSHQQIIDKIIDKRMKEYEEEKDKDLAELGKAFEEDRRRRRWRDAMWNRKSILQAARDEIKGSVAQSDSIVEAYKQEVINLQQIVAARGPRVQELLSNPQARDLFTSDKFLTLFGALDKDPKHVKAEILSDILRLEQAQTRSCLRDVDNPQVKATTTLIMELLVSWGPKLAKEYWDTVTDKPVEFGLIDTEQVERFSDLLE